MIACANLNHRRANAPVRHCPQCGNVLNDSVRTPPCNNDEHMAARRTHAAFCIRCGTQLIAPRR
jgi:ribosomal protein S27E